MTQRKLYHITKMVTLYYARQAVCPVQRCCRFVWRVEGRGGEDIKSKTTCLLGRGVRYLSVIIDKIFISNLFVIQVVLYGTRLVLYS